jgi:WD40 repeat protein
MLAFRPAFDEKERNRLIKQVTTAEPVRLGKWNRHVPQDLQTVVHKAIDKDPGQRYASAGALAEDLQRFVEDEPIQARRVSQTERLRRWCRRNPVVAGLAAALALVFLTGFAGVAWKWQEAERQKDLSQAAERSEAEQRAIAVEQADAAKREADQSRRLLYAADMTLACQAFDAGDTGRARALLERQRPTAGQEPFEWRYLWRLCHDGSRQTLRGHTGEVTGLTLTKDGRTLATCGTDQSVCIWDLSSRQHVKLRTGNFSAVAFAPNGKTLALAPWSSQMVQLWDLAERRVTASFPVPSVVYSVAVSPDGRLLAAGSMGTVRIWDVKTGRESELYHTPLRRVPIFCVAFSPDGRTLASGTADCNVRLWDVAAGHLRATLRGHSFYISSLSFSPDGKTLASASADTTVRFWDATSGQPVDTLRGPKTSVNAVAFSPDGTALATGGEDGTIRIWGAAKKEATALLRGHTGPITAVAFAPDGQSLFSGSRDGTVKVWNLAPVQDPDVLTGHKGSVSSVAFSDDGKTLAVADTYDNSVRLWDLASRKGVDRFTHSLPVFSVTFAPGGRTLASTSADGTLRLWDVGTRQQVAEFSHSNHVKSCAFSPDGKFVAATVGSVEDLLVREVTARDPVKKFSGSNAHFSPDGTLMAAALGRIVQLWDVATWQGLPPLTGFTSPVRCLAFAPDGKSLAACEENGTVRLWDLVGKRPIAQRRAHTSTVVAVAFSPDGRRLATGGGDSTVKLWDVPRLQEVATLTGHDGPVQSVAFSPDGHTLASASTDATVRLWQAPPLPEVDREPAKAPSPEPPLETIHLFALNVLGKARATRFSEGDAQRVEVAAVDDTHWHVQLFQTFGDLQEGATYTVRFRARADAARPVELYAQVAELDFHGIGLNEAVPVTKDWSEYQYRYQAKDLAVTNQIVFNLGDRTGTVWIADFTVTRGAE